MGRRILVTGGRSNYDYRTIDLAVSLYLKEDDILVHGDASGVDRIAAQAAIYRGNTVDYWTADWQQYGKAAGVIRNKAMLDSGIDFALVFAGGRGTADMVKRLKEAGVPYQDYSNFYGGNPGGK